MALPRTLVYNDLTGDEVKHILVTRFQQLLQEIPYLQKHVTLPRVRMSLMVTLECWADQKYPETRQILDQVEVRAEGAEPPPEDPPPVGIYKDTVIDASSKGDPPDKVREDHGLPVPNPSRSPEPWRSMAVSDQLPDPVEGRRIKMENGAIVDRTGNSDEARSSATIVKQDFGPARERINRNTALPLRNQERGGSVAPINWGVKDE